MVRETIDKYHIDGVRVQIGFDSGGPVGATTVVSIGRPDVWAVTRWFYFDEDNQNYVQNFAQKVVTDEDYQEACLDRTADWARVADQYEETSRQILQYFRDAGVLGYTAGGKEDKQVYDEATTELNSICESLFSKLKTEIRGDGDSNKILTISEAHKTRAVDWLQTHGHMETSV